MPVPSVPSRPGKPVNARPKKETMKHERETQRLKNTGEDWAEDGLRTAGAESSIDKMDKERVKCKKDLMMRPPTQLSLLGCVILELPCP